MQEARPGETTALRLGGERGFGKRADYLGASGDRGYAMS